MAVRADLYDLARRAYGAGGSGRAQAL